MACLRKIQTDRQTVGQKEATQLPNIKVKIQKNNGNKTVEGIKAEAVPCGFEVWQGLPVGI